MAGNTILVVFRGKDKVTPVVRDIKGSLSGLTNQVTRAGKVLAGAFVAAGAGAAALGAKMLEMGGDAVEVSTLMQYSLGSRAEQLDETLRQFASSANRSFYELKEGASVFVAMTKSMGFSREEAAEFSAQMVQMGVDLGSFFNRADQDVFDDIRRAMAGSSETMQKYGIDVRETTLKQMALNQGLIESATDLIPRDVRARLILQQVMTQGADAMGDAARTADNFQNAMRGMRAALIDTGTEIGLSLIDVIKPLIPIIRDGLQAVMQRLQNTFLSFKPTLVAVGRGLGIFINAIRRGQDPIISIARGIRVFQQAAYGTATPLEELKIKVAEFIAKVMGIKTRIQTLFAPVVNLVKKFVSWKDVLITLGVLIGAVILKAILALTPLIVTIGVVLAIVTLLRNVWESDWMGIRTATVKAIQKISAYIKSPLLPMFNKVWAFVKTYILPILAALGVFIVSVLVIRIKTMIFVLKTLVTAFRNVWRFIKTSVLPVLREAADFLKDVWNKRMVTARRNVDKFKRKLRPLVNFLKKNFPDAFEKAKKLIDDFKSGINSLKDGVAVLKREIGKLVAQFMELTIPDWIMPGSPTPFELGIRGIRKAIEDLNKTPMPLFMQPQSFAPASTTQTQIINQNWTINTERFEPIENDTLFERFLQQ